METHTKQTPVSKSVFWISWIITILVGLFLLFDAIMKLMKVQQVIEANVKYGYPENVVFGIGLALLLSTILYLVPKTAVLGAILLTAYLGGATNTHVHAGEPFFFPVVFGILVWLSLYLRDNNLRELIPIRKNDNL